MKYASRTPNRLIPEWRKNVYKMRDEESLFFESIEWKNRREECYLRDAYTCKRCGAKRTLTPHHIIPREEGGTHELTNLITLCERCHDYVELDDSLRTWNLIVSSYNEKIEPKKEDLDLDPDRPDWHAWVYGGQRNPRK